MFLIDKYAITTPTTASDIGIAINEHKETPPLFPHTIDTIIIADIIVVGTDFFLMPKNSGISPIPVAASALTQIVIKLFSTKVVVSLSGIKL